MSRRPPKPSADRSEETVIQPLGLLDIVENRWRIEKKIGSGSMGTVFSAWDLEAKQRVAVKILSPELCRKPPFIARFEREARLMAALNHPNLVPLLAIGRRGALPFLVMPYLEGITLAEHLQQRLGKLAPVETYRIIKQVCAGLTCVHAQKLVHRDVKPQNIFLAPDGHATLLDLGVARDQSDPGLTRPGVRIGTPYYMAPEQILGQQDVDHRADLYALGAVVFELFTGTPPFMGKNHHEVLRAHRELPPPDASQVSRLVSRAAADVLIRALAKSPRERFQSAQDFLSALEDAYDFALEGDDDQTSPHLPALSAPGLEKNGSTLPPEPPEPSDPSLPWSPSLAQGGGVMTTPQLDFPPPDSGPHKAWPDQAARPTSPLQRAPPVGDEYDLPPTGEDEVLSSGFDLLASGTDARGERETETEAGGGVVRVIPLLNGVVTPAHVHLDGRALGPGPVTVTVAPGTYRIRVQRTGMAPLEKELRIALGQRVVLKMELDRG